MIYYHEIVQNYYRDKTSACQIIEQEQALDPQAEKLANEAEAAAKNASYKAPHLAKTLAGKPPSGFIAVWNAGGGVIKFNPTVDPTTGKFTNNVATRKVAEYRSDFVSYFKSSSGGQETSSKDSQSGSPEGGEEVSLNQKPSKIIIRGKEYILYDKYNLFEGNLLEPEEFEEIVKESEGKISIDDIGKFLNGQGGNGSVARLILYARDSIERSSEEEGGDEEMLLPYQESDNLSDLKLDASEKIYEVFQILKTNKGQLDIESTKILKNSIAISEEGEIFIKTDSTGEGLVITQGSSEVLSKVLDHMANKLVDPETGKNLTLRLNTVSFIKQFKMGRGDSAFTRGFFFEDVRRGIIHQRKYNQALAKNDTAAMALHRKDAEKQFARWLGKTKKVSAAFESMLKFFIDNGSIAYDINDAQASLLMHFIKKNIGSGDAQNNIANIQSGLRTLSGLLIRFGAAGVTIRRPDDILPTATKVGFGLKADSTEVYAGTPQGIKALSRVGITDERIVSRMVKAMKGSKKVTIGESIKFMSASNDIKLGDSSREFVVDLFKLNDGLGGVKEEARQQYNFLTSLGFNSSDFNLLKNEYQKFDQDYDTLVNTKTYSTIGADNKEITVDGKEAILRSAIDMISSNDDINDKSSEALLLELKSKLKNYLRNKKASKSMGGGVDPRFKKKWEKTSRKIAMLLQRKRIMKTFKDNPRNGVGIVALLGLTSGGSADGCILSVADTVAGSLYTTEQTSTLKDVIASLSNPETADLTATSSGFKLNGVNILFNGNKATCYIGKDRVLKTIKEDGIGSIQKVMGSELDLSSLQIMIKNQMQILESFWKIIAKDDQN